MPKFPDGVYPVELILTNCNGDFNVLRPDGLPYNITIGCGIISFSDENSSDVNIFNPTTSLATLVKSKEKVDVKISPNPTTGSLRIISSADIGKATIKITNILGIEQANFYVNDILKYNELEYDISNLTTGMYIISSIR